VVAVLVATVLSAAVLKLRATRGARAHATAATMQALRGDPPAGPHGLGAGAPPAGVEASGEARMVHGDVRHTHRVSGRVPTALLRVVWSRDVGGPVEAQVTVSPDGQTLYVASLGGAVTALARADGEVRWSVALGDRAYATPGVAADGTLYAGADGGKLVALTPEGKTKWTLDTDGDADTGPALAKDGTIVVAGGRMVYAVTPLGYVKWRFAARRKVFTAPAIAPSGRIVFGSQDHHAYALSPEGALVWSTDLGADVDGAPVVGDDGAVFVGTDGDELVRLDEGDGHVVWRANVGGFVRGTLSAARDGDVLAGVYGPTPRLVRVRAGDGSLRGELRIQGTGARQFGVHGGALEDEAGTLLFGAQDDDVYAVSADGDLLWRFPTGGDVDAPLTLLADGSVVVASDDGKVYLVRSK
jgi:outer membrane protein assembly factor BamB